TGGAAARRLSRIRVRRSLPSPTNGAAIAPQLRRFAPWAWFTLNAIWNGSAWERDQGTGCGAFRLAKGAFDLPYQPTPSGPLATTRTAQYGTLGARGRG